MEFTLLGAAALGLGSAILVARLRVPDATPHSALIDPMWAAVGAAIFGGRIASMLASGTNPLTHPGDILLVRGGVSTTAASIIALAIWAWGVRVEPGRLSDLAAPAILVGLGGWHAGCLVRGACAGTGTDLPWAISLGGSAVGRHPVEIYAALAFVAAAVVLARLAVGDGRLFAFGLAAAGLIRLGTEPFRLSIGGGPVLTYAAAVVGGLALAAVLTRRRPDGVV